MSENDIIATLEKKFSSELCEGVKMDNFNLAHQLAMGEYERIIEEGEKIKNPYNTLEACPIPIPKESIVNCEGVVNKK